MKSYIILVTDSNYHLNAVNMNRVENYMLHIAASAAAVVFCIASFGPINYDFHVHQFEQMEQLKQQQPTVAQ